jgi:hypothetical protein
VIRLARVCESKEMLFIGGRDFTTELGVGPYEVLLREKVGVCMGS